MDNMERAQLCVLNRKHQFIMRLGEVGRTPGEAKKFVEMIEWEKEILWAVMCYDACDAQPELEDKRQAQTQAASGS